MGFQFCVFMRSLSMRRGASVSESITVSCTFSWAVFLLFVLSCSFLFVLFYYCPSNDCFLRRLRKGVDLEGRRGGEKLEGVEGRETIVRIYCVGKHIYN